MAKRELQYSARVDLLNVNGWVALDGYRRTARPTDWLALYEDSFPEDPNTGYQAWDWYRDQPFLTDKKWSSRWRAAYVGKNAYNGKWKYLAQVSAPQPVARSSRDMWVEITKDSGKIRLNGNDTGSVHGHDWIGLYWVGRWWEAGLLYPRPSALVRNGPLVLA